MFVNDSMFSLPFYCKFLRYVSWIQTTWTGSNQYAHRLSTYLYYMTRLLVYKLIFTITLGTETWSHARTQFSIMKWEFAQVGNQICWWQQRCWAPAVFLLMSFPLPGWEKGQSTAPQTQCLQLSFQSVGRPLDQLYTRSQTVHASRVWTWAQVEPWGGRYLPQYTVAKHHGQSRSSSCCSTTIDILYY